MHPFWLRNFRPQAATPIPQPVKQTPRRQWAPGQPASRVKRVGLNLLLLRNLTVVGWIPFCPALLSGCGTSPSIPESPAPQSWQPIPAQLLTPPHRPAPLAWQPAAPASASPTPGPTTPPTLPAAPPIAPASPS